MANTRYPKVTAKAWAVLRNRAAAAPTVKFTHESVAALLGMANPKSARDNIVSPMRRLGLIDEEGALTARGNSWRLDASFGEACQEILDEIYPDELATLAHDDGTPDATQVRTWFDHQGFGVSNAAQMTATYVMIAGKEIPDPPVPDSGKGKKAKSSSAKNKTPKSSRSQQSKEPRRAEPPEPASPSIEPNGTPTVHLDIQIHIPADATPEQIDQIFSSMARNLYGK